MRMLKKWLPAMAALLVICGALRLAVWQLDRAEFKQDLLASSEHAPTVELAAVDRDTPRFARVLGSGRFDTQRHILLDNQTFKGQAGVHVYTPFVREPDGRIFLVNRGWMPFARQSVGAPVSARTPPRQIPTPDGITQIVGLLNTPPQTGARLGHAQPLDPQHWPNLMTYLEIGLVREVLGPELDVWIIQLDAEHAAGFEGRDWRVVTMGPERHRAYAFQWGLIALVVSAIWIILHARSRRARTTRSAMPVEPGETRQADISANRRDTQQP